MKKILALGFLGFAYACTSEQKTAGGCYEDSQEYRVATNKTITNLVLTEIVDVADAQSRGYTAADVGKYGISNCDGSSDGSTDHKKWGDEVNGNVVECESVYEKNGDSNLAPRLVRKLKTLDGPDGGTYHRILLQTNAMCDTITDTDKNSWCSDANGYSGALIDNADSTECAGETCSEVVDAEKCCHVKACTCTDGEGATGTACPTNGVNKCISCTSADKFLSGGECKEGITGNKFKSLSESKTARSSDVVARDRLNAFYIKLQEKYVEGGRSDFQTFNKVELKDTRKSLVEGKSMKYSRVKDGVTINRKTFGRVKMTEEKARENKIAITKSDGELEILEFDMEHADNDPDFQSFNFGAFEILCETISATTASCANDDGPGRRLDQLDQSCFRGASATYDDTDDVWTFDPGLIEFSYSCAVSETNSETNGQYTISQCTYGTYSRNTEWDTYSDPLVCSLCPPGSGVISGSNPAQCEACNSGSDFNSEFDSSACDECPTGSTPNSDGQSCTCNAGWTGGGYPSTDPNPGCTQCEAGEYDDGSEVCKPCAAGSVQPDPGQTDCDQCAAGKAASSATGTCEDCQPGFFQSGVDDNYACEACESGASGTYTSEVGQTACKSCSLFSTEWINTQCCSDPDSTQCGRLLNQCGTSC